MQVQEALASAQRSGQQVRIHTHTGEVLVAHVLALSDRELRYAVITSSRPERYAVCDSTGFLLPLEGIARVQRLAPVDPTPTPRRGPIDPSDRSRAHEAPGWRLAGLLRRLAGRRAPRRAGSRSS